MFKKITKMDIKNTFLKLTERTYPNGSESELYDLLPSKLEADDFGNLFIEIGEKPSCMFTSHLDTATSANSPVNHVFDGDIIKTDGTSILGADDKAGVTIMLNMIEHNISGLYYFFLGEEVGCLGSRHLSNIMKTEKIEYISKVISFDRRGTDSVITYQSGSRCCSDDFGTALAEQLNKSEPLFSYKNDPTGIYTDSAQFTTIYPECTNISVGYISEHTTNENQNIRHLELLADAVLKVDWESLPVVRDPSKVESRYRYNDYSYYGWGADDDDYVYTAPVRSRYDAALPTNKKEHFWDNDYDYVSSVEINTKLNSLLEIDFSNRRIEDEEIPIMRLLESLDVEYEDMHWDGMKLTVKHTAATGGHTTQATREELVEFLPDLDFWRYKQYEHISSSAIKQLESLRKGSSDRYII